MAKPTYQALGSLEQEIMLFVWANGRSTVRDVFETIRETRPIAYTTVMTTMNRLAEKGVLHEDTTDRYHGYAYTAVFTKPEFITLLVERLLDEFGVDDVECYRMVQDLHAVAERRGLGGTASAILQRNTVTLTPADVTARCCGGSRSHRSAGALHQSYKRH
jgi:predicted transcriptional regulator